MSFVPGLSPSGAKAWFYSVLFGTTEQGAEKGAFESEIQPRVLQGLKPDIDLMGFIGTTEEAAEKLGILDKNGGKRPSAAKASIDLIGFMRGLKPPPPSVLSFSAACEVMP